MKKNYILFLSLLVLGLFGKSNAASVKTITDDFGSYMATCCLLYTSPSPRDCS